MKPLTERQKQIMEHVFRGAPTSAFIDIDELMEKLGIAATKQAVQCSIRILEKEGLVERDYVQRRGRRRMVIKPTPKAYVQLKGMRL